MGIFEGCMIACDVDGTLMDNGYINPRTVESIEYFMSEGGRFSLSTGRSQAALDDIFAVIKTVSPSVLANGTVIYDFENEKNLLIMGVCKEDKRIPKMIHEKYSDVGIEIHSGSTVFNANENEETRVHERYEHLNLEKIDFDAALEYDWNKVLYLFSSLEELKSAIPLFESLNTGSRFIESSAIIEGKRRYYYEQIPSGVSKASSLMILCDMFKIKKGGFFAIGDYYNDLEMIKQADISACPESSPEEIKKFATVTVCNAQDGAVADFVEYLKNKFS